MNKVEEDIPSEDTKPQKGSEARVGWGRQHGRLPRHFHTDRGQRTCESSRNKTGDLKKINTCRLFKNRY